MEQKQDEKKEEIKKLRRKIEDKLRKDFSEKKMEALATLLDIEPTKSTEAK